MEKIGFISASGDSYLPKENESASPYFVVVAAILDRAHLAKVEQQITTIKSSYTHSPTWYQKALPHSLRLDLLASLSLIPFNLYGMVIDKRNIAEGSGLSYQDSFFKYFNNLLDTDLYRYYPVLELVSNPYGSKDFMKSFIQYVKHRHLQTDMFRKPSFRFGHTASETLLQLSSFLANTLREAYEAKHLSFTPYQVAETLQRQILHIREFPELPLKAYLHSPEEKTQRFHQHIANFSRNMALRFIEEHQAATDPTTILQVKTLNYLLYRFRLNPFDYIYTDELLRRVNSDKEHIFSKQMFRSEVISGLRDKNVLLVSGQSGYKLPACEQDLFSFFNRYNQIIQPMIHRLEKCNLLVKIATQNELDLLATEAYETLREMVAVTH